MNLSIKAIKGSSQLAFDSVEGITNTVERMHQIIARARMSRDSNLLEPAGVHGDLASTVYSTIRGINGTLREGVGQSLKLLPDSDTKDPQSGGGLLSALNGVLGDHLSSTDNALSIPMQFTTEDHVLDLDRDALSAAMPQASPHLVILVHGLCMSEQCWSPEDVPPVGGCIEQQINCNTLYLRYNSGRHISTNGQELTAVLEQLCNAWPVPVESLSLVGHSMGGLVIRSACWYAQQQESHWVSQLKRVICLGTPHHGSPLERAGHALDVTLQKIPYMEPLVFTRLRSAGIKDLRHGNLLDQDWQGHNPDRPRPDSRRAIPLLPDVDYYFAAATIGQSTESPLGQLLGDLLVSVDSAVGWHRDQDRTVNIKAENCQVFHQTNHMNLLSDENVVQQVINWLKTE